MIAFLYAIGVFAFVVYAYVSVRRPGWALAVLFFAAPFQHDIGLGGIRFSVAEILLLVNGAVSALVRGRLRPGPVLAPALLYVGVCILSCTMHPRESGLVSIAQMAVYLIAAVYVGAWLPCDDSDIKQAFRGIIASGIFLGCVAVATRSMHFFELHKNGLGASFSSAFLAAFILWDQDTGSRRWRQFYFVGMLVTMAGGLMVASRGAWLGTIAALLLLFVYQRRFKMAFRAAIFCAMLVPLLWMLVPKNTREFAADLSADSYNVNARLESITYARKLFEEDILWGSGVGLRKEYDATNLVMTTLAETGVVGLGAFLLLILAVYWSFHRSYQAVEALSAGSTALVAACICIFTTRLAHGMVDHYWGRGVLTLGWTSVGLAWALRRLAWAQSEVSDLQGEDLDGDGEADVRTGDEWREAIPSDR